MFDTETTGFNYSQGDRIIELAGVKIIDNIIDTKNIFNTFIATTKLISEDSLKIHNISMKDIKNAPDINTVITNFIDFVGDSILIAHNAQFDISFLKPEWEHISPFVEFPTTLCSKEMDKLFYPDDKFHNLDIVCAKWGVNIDNNNRHRALADAIMTAKCVQKMLSQNNKKLDLNYLIEKTAKHKDWRHR